MYICVCIIYMLCALYYAAKFPKKVVFLKIKEINGENDVDICNKMRAIMLHEKFGPYHL